jgi:hypothetical protein
MSVDIDTNKNHKAVRVGFHPTGMYRLLGFSMEEMIDGSYNAEDVFGNELVEVNLKLQEASSCSAIRTVI